ncbi:hypothetical protein NUACC21_19330 [Scytonema sp. NUACC21]
MADIFGTIYNDNSTTGPDGKFHTALFGTSENDYMRGDEGDDALYGFEGTDVIIGDAGNDAVVGYQGNDYLFGSDGDDTLGEWYHGEPGSDWLDGGNGNDILYGYGRDTEGTEYDNLTGGEGADKFVLGQETTTFVNGYAYYLGDGYATIHDFKWWEGLEDDFPLGNLITSDLSKSCRNTITVK